MKRIRKEKDGYVSQDKLCEENDGTLISVDTEDYGHLYQNKRWNFISPGLFW